MNGIIYASSSDTLEQIDVAKLLIDQYPDVSSVKATLNVAHTEE